MQAAIHRFCALGGVSEWEIRRMKTNRQFVLLALVVGCCYGIAQTETPFVTLGSIQIRLGGRTAKAVADLQKDYVVQSDDKAPMREWLVSARKDSIPMLVIFSKGDEIVWEAFGFTG